MITYFYRKSRQGANSIEELFNTITGFLDSKIKVEKLEVPYGGASFESIWCNLKWAGKHKINLCHITGDIHYMALGTGNKTVLTIHDVQSILRGNFLKQLYLKIFWFWLPSIFVKKITVISEFSRQELIRVIPWAKHKIVVVHNPVNGKILERANFEINTPNPASGVFKILLLGTKENKNLLRTFEALSVLPCELTIIGQLNEKQKEALDKYAFTYQNLVHIPFEQVIDAYLQCDLVCFASTYEGFGMPIIEAQALGKPIVTSNVASMPEIAADSAILVNPYDVNSIRGGVSSLMFDEKLRKEKIKQGYKNIERFKIEIICQQYLDIYKEIWNDK